MNALPTPTHTQRLLTIASILLCSHTIGTAGSTNDENTFTKEGFLTAIANKDTQTIERYIDHDKNTYINMYDEDGAKTTALFAVIQSDNTNNEDQNDFIAKKEALVNKLITQGANTTHKDTSRKTALHLAIQADLSIDTIKQLLGPNKENLNAANNHTYTPMYWARLHKKPIQLMQWLIEQGANLNAQYSSNTGVSGGWSSDEDNDNQNKTETLLQVAQNDLQKSKDYDEDQATQNRKSKIVQFLEKKEKGAKVFRDAFTQGNLTTLQQCITDKKAYIDTPGNEYNNTVLFLALTKEDENSAQQFLQQGANPNHRNKRDVTPLHIAACFNCLTIAGLLLTTYKVPVDAADNSGYTPLWFAYKFKHIKMMELLLQYNANLDIKNGENSTIEEKKTLLELATKNKQNNIVNLLKKTIQDRKDKQNLGTGRSQNRNNNQQNRNSNNNLGLNNDEQKNDTNNNINNNGQNNNTGQKPKDDKRLQKFAGIAAAVITVLALLKWITTPPPTPDKRTRATSKSNKHK